MEKIRRKTQTKRKTPLIKTLFVTMLATVALAVGGVSVAWAADDAPVFAKNLQDNGDGTYTLSLSVTGQTTSSTTTEVNKANVILVIDTSSSMNTETGSTYYEVPGTPTYSSAGVTPTYYRLNNGQYQRLYWRNNQWRTSNSDNGTIHTGTFYSLSRFWAEYHALTDDGGIVDSLLAQNTTQDPDIIEIAIASFGGSGSPKLDFSGDSNTNAAAIKDVISGLSTSQGTNWEEGLIAAHTIYNTLSADEKANEKTYVIFLTDGEPTTWANHYTVSDRDDAFDEAKDNAHTLVDTDKAEFYGVFTWGSSTYYGYLQSLVGYAYEGSGEYNTGDQGHGDHVFNATSTEELISALKQIASSITNEVGYTDTGVHDGVTSMTSSTVKAQASGEVTGVKYYRSGGSYGTANPAEGNYGTEWEEAPAAKIGEDGVINWELGENFDLEDGVTYTMTFVVWPKQASLDLVADLNNGIKSYDSLTDDQKSQIKQVGGKYALKTNTDYPSVSYKTYTEELDEDGKPIAGTRVESVLKTSEIGNPDPVGLAEEKLNALKIWEDSLDPSQRADVGESVTLYLMVDGKAYYIDEEGNPAGVTLLKSENWEKSDYISIAPGIMVTENSPAYDPNAIQVTYNDVTYALIEEGHDYVFKESETDKHFELTAYHHHPMIMGEKADGTPNVVDVIFTYDSDDNITGIEDIKELTDSLSATNTLKGGINITKQVVDESGEAINDPNPFTIKVTMTDPDGNALPTKTDGTTQYTIDYRIYYGPNNPNYNAEDTSTDPAGGRSGHIYKTGTEFTETIYVGDMIRIVNVEDDTIYTVTETAPTGYEYVSTTYEIAYGGVAANRKVDPDHQVQGNSASYAQVTNKYTYGALEVSKAVSVTSGDADKAKAKEFTFTLDLYSDDTKATALTGNKYDYTITKADSSTTTGTYTVGTDTFKLKDGDKIKFDKLPEAAYYEVTETAVDGFTTTPATRVASGTITKNQTAQAAFTNTYSVTPVSVDPPVKKDITGNDDLYNKGDFTFTIENTAKPDSVTTAPMPTNTSITNSATYELELKDAEGNPVKGYYEFGDITFTVPGTYTYKVTESGSVLGVTNDSAASTGKTFTFTVTDNEKGALTVTPTSDQAVFEFTNAYKTGELDITKTIVNTADPTDNTKFTFTVELKDSTGAAISGSFPYSIGEASGTIASGGTLQLTNGETAIITGIPEGASYTVTETAVTGYENTGKTGDTGTISSTAASVAEFTNTYKASGEATITVTKAITGAAWPTGKELTLTIAGPEGAPMPTTTSKTLSAAGDVSFGPITYSVADVGKSYEYTITEDGFGDGWTGTPTSVKATVAITNAGGGELSAAVTYNPTEATITNTYAAKGSATLKADKELTGRAWQTDETVTFTLTDSNGAKVDEKTIGENGTITFKEIEYTMDDMKDSSGAYVKEKTFEYTISETSTLPGGVTKSADIKATVVVTDNGDGTLGTSVSYTNNDKIINDYTTQPVKAQINIAKTIDGFVSGGDQTFNFTMTGPKIDGSLTASITTTNGYGTASFTPIEFTFDDMVDASGNHVTTKDFTYTVQETAGSAPGFTYDTDPYNVIVTVTDDQNGNLTVSDVYKVETETIHVEVVNEFGEQGTSVTLHVDKVIDDQSGSAEDAEFTFVLSSTEGAPGAPQTKTVKTENLKGGIDFDAIEFTEAGTFNYTIKESGEAPSGWTYDTKEYPVVITITDDFTDAILNSATTIDGETTTSLTITNIYKATPVKTKLQVTKVVDDKSGSAPKDVTFEFTLATTDESPMPEKDAVVTAKAGETVEFGEIEYSKVDDYNYTITETKGGDTAAGWTNDTTSYKVIVTVTDGGGALAASAVYVVDDKELTELTVTNTYEPQPAKVELQARKVVDDPKGYAPKDVEFSFDLIGPDGKVVETKTITGGGYVKFSELTFDKIGDYKYQIQEQQGSAYGFTYDTTAYDVTISVTDPGKGQLAATIDYGDDELVITNPFKAEPVTIDPPVQKIVKGSPATDETFTFQLKAVTEDAPMPKDSADGVKTITITGSGTDEFGEISYDAIGNYTYEITEIAGNTDGYTYDDTKYFLAVVVSANKDGSLAVSQAVVDSNSNSADKAVFTNTYEEEPPSVPKTGDDLAGVMTPLALVAVASGLLTLGLGRKLRKED